MMVEKIKATKDDVKVYLDNAEDRIRSAEGLLAINQYNDAISRAYYAFFDAARAALLAKDLIVKTHGGLKTIFHRDFIKTGEMPVKFGRYLDRAFEARQEADYNAKAKFSKEDVRVAIASAKEFVAAVEKIIINSRNNK